MRRRTSRIEARIDLAPPHEMQQLFPDTAWADV